MNNAFIPTDFYLPDWAKDTQFFQDIKMIIDYLENSLDLMSNEKYALIEQSYKDIIYKYQNILELSEEALKLMLIENGFKEILNLFNFSLDRLQTLVLYLPLLKILKSTPDGFSTLLSLLASKYEFETWLDNPQELDEYTYQITLISFLNLGFDEKIISKFKAFSRSYVYPVLTRMIISVIYKQLAPAVYGRPIINKNIKIKCFDEV